MKISWLSRAADDLENIFDHIWEDRPRAAAREVDKVLDAVAQLSRHPSRGRPGRVAETRELVVSPYIVAYRVKGGELQILRVIHGARRWPRKP